MSAPVDPKFRLFQNLPDDPAPKHRGVLDAPIPVLQPPPKPAPKTKPEKPTQAELIRDEVQADYSKLINYLKKVEGTPAAQAKMGFFKAGRFHIYDDVGAPAIGYGHRLLPEELKAGWGKKGITEEEATEVLMRDIKKAEQDAIKHFGRKGWSAMDNHRRMMAIDFAYNLGYGGLAEFKRFSRALRMGDVRGITQRYKRHYTPVGHAPGEPKPELKARNDPFYKTFIAPMVTGEVGVENVQPIRQTNRPTRTAKR
jgi:GH24 family phage-related lysozyme (muramidase)